MHSFCALVQELEITKCKEGPDRTVQATEVSPTHLRMDTATQHLGVF